MIHCGDDVDSIDEAITQALSEEVKFRAKTTPNPYQQEGTVDMIVDRLVNCDITQLLPKKFYDI